MKRLSRLAVTLFVCFALIGAAAAALAASPVFPVDREFYPYYPSLIKWNKSSVPFNAPEVCGGCHEKQYK